MSPLCCTCQWFYSIVCKRHYLPCGKVYFLLSFLLWTESCERAKTARALRQWGLSLFLIKSFPKRIQMALKFKKPDSLRLWTGIINKSNRKLQVARWSRMEIQGLWISDLLLPVTLQDDLCFQSSHCCAYWSLAVSPVALLTALSCSKQSIIQALFELAAGCRCVLFFSLSPSLSLACSNRGCCISQRNVQFLPPPRR